MPQFLTVKEAAQQTGKSSSSIRRIIYPILETDGHPDRLQIQPTVEDVQQLRMRGENFAWKISQELLQREIPPEPPAEKGSDKPGSRGLHDSDAELLSMLRKELDIKNQQITQQAAMLAAQMEVMSGLSERLREGNILIGSLQQQLGLGDGSHRQHPKSVEGEIKKTPTKTTAPQAATKPVAKATAKPSAKSIPPKPKRGFFSRIFG